MMPFGVLAKNNNHILHGIEPKSKIEEDWNILGSGQQMRWVLSGVSSLSCTEMKMAVGQKYVPKMEPW